MIRQKKTHSKKKGAIRPGLVITSLLLAVSIGVTGTAVYFKDIVNLYLAADRTRVSEEEMEKTAQESQLLSHRIQEEGSVLLKNTKDTLPLSDSIRQVNVFGWASTQWLGGGSGSGRITQVKTDFLAALRDAGVSYNEELIGMYREFQPKRPYSDTLNSWPQESCRLYEPHISDREYYTEELLDHARDYSDTAIAVIGRFAGESNDCPKVQYKQTKKGGEITEDPNRTYLDLSKEEEDLLRYLGVSYKNVILVLNTGNVMALGAIERLSGIDACLYAGLTGESGAGVLPEILWGRVSPSGRTTDTWAYDFSTAASYANAGGEGVGRYTNAETLYPADGTKCGNLGENFAYDKVSYVDYAEGIYVGYRWYETADAQHFWDGVENRYGRGYDGVVQYPFGYGLSYTEFQWELLEAPKEQTVPDPFGEISVMVRVTNTGKRAGQDVIQLYVSPPYTPGGIEKSSVALAAYAKTSLLEPGACETLTLTVPVSSFASYDEKDANKNGFQGYELEAGIYELSLRSDAHHPAAMDQNTIRLYVPAGTLYDTDRITGAPVFNKFTGEQAQDGVSIDGSDAGGAIHYLSRADFNKTFPKANVPVRRLSHKGATLNLYTKELADTWHSDETWTASDEALRDKKSVKKLTLMVERMGSLTDLGYGLGKNWEDPRWEEVLDQLTFSDMENLFLHGYVKTEPLSVLGKPLAREADGPAQIGSFHQIPAGTGFPNAGILAQTWNNALAREMGRAIAKEAGQFGYSGWYAPAVNLHRSPFDGRNYEYYSEDPLISGHMGGLVVRGSLDMGVYCYVKHLICNDQESGIYRDGIYTWMTEQTLRELYLKPFQMLVQDYGATGFMTAYNRIGAVWAGGSQALLTGILKEEWGFHGAIVTDYADHHKYMNGDQALRAGGSLWMDGILNDGKFRFLTEENEAFYYHALRRTSKEVLYMYLNARAENREYSQRMGDPGLLKPVIYPAFPLWGAALGAFDLMAASAFLFCLRRTKKPEKKKKRRE